MKTFVGMMVAGAVMVTVAASVQAASGIKGSPHDFSGTDWADGEMCLPCHIPHNAITEIGGTEIAFLWNHAVTTQDFLTESTNVVLGASSLACLSCHDGVTAVDSYSGKSGTILMGDINPDAVIGTDLRDDHAVGVLYGTSTRRAQSTGVAGGSWSVKSGSYSLRLSGSTKTTARMECTTCHTPHSNANEGFLRMPNAGSALCAACHISQYDGSTSVYTP
jgi:predicted CXXCH cytochrome family protein